MLPPYTGGVRIHSPHRGRQGDHPPGTHGGSVPGTAPPWMAQDGGHISTHAALGLGWRPRLRREMSC
jgi:hypothetical protein